MYIKEGLYVFPNGKKIKLFAYDGTKAVNLGETTYAEQLIDFLEINTEHFRKAVNNLKAFIERDADISRAIDSITFLADNFCIDTPVYAFLMHTELADSGEEFNVYSKDDAVKYRDIGLDILETMLNMHTMLFYLTYIYCTSDGTHEEKVRTLSLGRNAIYNCRFEEIISAAEPDVKMFDMTEICYPLTKGYHFTDIKNFLWFVFINSLQNDVNLSRCRYCGHFFIPKTKRATHYCNRTRTSDGRTCKDIGPAFIKKLRSKNSSVLSEYDKAINRNFKRVERFENKLSNEKTGKDLTYNEYAEWINELHHARELWNLGEMSDEEFIRIIHSLD